MTAELGHLALILAWSMAILQALIPLIGAHYHNSRLMATAPTLAFGQMGFLLASFICLGAAFIHNDFSIVYVAQNANSQLPIGYRISAIWGGHEGSLLLWVLILSGWTATFAAFSRELHSALRARVIGILGLISTGFLAFLQLTSNPFERLLPDFPLDGRDLNPLLQDFGLIIHPPILYMGYVGFAVTFALVTAALLGGRLDSQWARASRPWTLAAWCFLTIGIALGSWWAYYELGWGGWWFWDPVENASFMPWLIGTALIHSLAVTEKRGVFNTWTALLAIAAFSLSILGTFLVRSGVLTSVHAFANDPTRGLFILLLLAMITGSALLLVGLRTSRLQDTGRFSLCSREMALLTNNLLLVGACSIVFIGTLFPLLVDVLQMGKLSVGPPYFNTLFVPLTLALLLTLGIGPLLRWKQDDGERLKYPLGIIAILSVLTGGLLPIVITGQLHFLLMITLSLSAWVIFNLLYDLQTKLRHKTNWLIALINMPRSYQGMLWAHLGLIVCVIGVAITSIYSVERDVRLALNETITVGNYQFQLAELRDVEGPNYLATQAKIVVLNPDNSIEAVLWPEKRFYTVQQMPMTEAAIQPGFTRDLYIALGESLGNNSWAVRIHYKPFVRWIWLGALIMAWGGLLALSDRRYRITSRTTDNVKNPVASTLPSIHA